jgi:O-antigen ligase
LENIVVIAYLKSIRDYVFYPRENLLSTGNLIYFNLCLCLGPLIGSVVSVYVIVGVIFGTWHLLWRNIPLPRSFPVLASAAAFASYLAAETISSVVNPGPNNLRELIENLPFLGILPLFAAVFVDRGRLLASVEKAAAAAAIAGYALYLAGMRGENGRAELFGGNAGVLAVLSSILLAVNCVAAWRRRDQKSWFSPIGAVASIGLILATGTRGMLPVIVLAPLAAAAALGGASRRQLTWPAAALAAAALLGVGGFAYNTLEIRAVVTGNEITAIKAGRNDTSIGQRLLLWRVGFEMFASSPLTGLGPGNAPDLMAARTKALSGVSLTSTHFHNAAINELARAGIIGLAALFSMFAVPFAACLRAEKDEIAKAGFAILCGVQCAYLLSGLTGIMLGHDILDTVYISSVVFALYLVFPEPGRAAKLART